MESNSATAGTKHKGVRGWLLLFCVSLTILSPLITVFNIISGYQEVSPYIAVFPGLLTITIIDAVLSIALTGFSIYAGIALWKIRTNAVKIAKKYLLTMLGYSILSAFLPFMAGLPSEANQSMISGVAKSLFRAIIYVAVWYSYLNKSVRVRETYDKIIP